MSEAESGQGGGTLAIASDHAGFELKERIKTALSGWGRACEDLGTHDDGSTDYPDYAHRLAEGVAGGRFAAGILVCGTGNGMGMAANRHPGIRAAVCTDAFTANAARAHNDANVLCIGSRVTGEALALEITRVFLESAFEGGRHRRRIEKIEVSGQ
jgi:ribose 5-phosphate isomerase B